MSLPDKVKSNKYTAEMNEMDVTELLSYLTPCGEETRYQIFVEKE